MVSQDMPVAEVDVDESLVRELLAAQHPDLADRPLETLAFGWDNVLFRLGEEHTVRLPRRHAAAQLIENEHRWLPVLAPHLPLRVPVAVRVGRPGCGYPWAWSVGDWVDGEEAGASPLEDPVGVASQLGAFLAALHRPAPADAPANPYRGVPLGERNESTEQRIKQLADTIDAPAVRDRWRTLVATSEWTGSPRWLHGDLHPANILVAQRRVAAVLDFGDITAGDPATDLSVAWMLLPPAVHPAFRAAAGPVDDATWTRARGWALSLALAYLASSANNERLAAIGRHTIAAVLADVPPDQR